jgi:hypothetical protein
MADDRATFGRHQQNVETARMLIPPAWEVENRLLGHLKLLRLFSNLQPNPFVTLERVAKQSRGREVTVDPNVVEPIFG